MSDIVSNPHEYFKKFIPVRDSLLLELEEKALREEIPIVGPVVGELLFILAWATKAQQILELGTATAYSSIYLARGCEPAGGHVVTVENDPDMAEKARQSLRKAGLVHRIKILEGDAQEKTPTLRGPFDLIFMDIDKENYINVLPDCERLLKLGGLLIVDNTGFVDSDPFNQAINNHPRWKIVQLFSFLPQHSPENDGLCIALKI